MYYNFRVRPQAGYPRPPWCSELKKTESANFSAVITTGVGINDNFGFGPPCDFIPEIRLQIRNQEPKITSYRKIVELYSLFIFAVFQFGGPTYNH